MKSNSKTDGTPFAGNSSRKMHYGFIIVACCCLMMGVNVGLTFSCAGIFYRPVSESLGVPVGEFGIYMSVMYVTSTLMLSIAGRMLERYSAQAYARQCRPYGRHIPGDGIL